MRASFFLIASLALGLSSCIPGDLDETGKACSTVRPCSSAWSCVAGRCQRSGVAGDGGVGLAVPRGSTFRYADQGTDLGTGWRAESFDDSAWPAGIAPIGYGMDGLGTTVCCATGAFHLTNYFRHAFTLTVAPAAGYTLRLRRDEGAVAYLNGTEAARSNLPSGEIVFSTAASTHTTGADETTFFEYPVPGSLLHQGLNVLAVEVHQDRPASDDAVLDVELQANP